MTTTPPSLETRIKALHAVYCETTGMQIPLLYSHLSYWMEWIRAGFTEDDLRLVVDWIQRGIKAEKWTPARLRFSYLIERPDRFAEEMAEAKATLRNAKPPLSAKERVLRQARPVACDTENGTVTAKPMAEYVAKALADLRKAVQ